MDKSISKYLGSVIPSWDSEKKRFDAPLNDDIVKKTLGAIAVDISKISLGNSSRSKIQLEELITKIRRLDVIIRAYSYIENISLGYGISKEVIDFSKEREFSEYKICLQSLNINDIPDTKECSEQISNMVSFVKCYLQKSNTDINARDTAGKTAFFRACERGNLPEVNLLSSIGCNVSLGDKRGFTPLGVAAQYGFAEIVSLLIENNVNINGLHGDLTPLSVAISEGQEECAKLLIKADANLNIAGKRGMKPMHLACEKGFKEIVSLLIEKKADLNDLYEDCTPLQRALSFDQEECATLLIKAGAYTNITNRVGLTPLHIASMKGFREVVTQLIEKKVNLNAPHIGCTPLHKAISSGNLECAKLLIEAQAKFDIHDEYGSKLFHLACLRGFKELIALLIEKGANVDEMFSINRGYASTPLHKAILSGNKECVKLLIEARAYVDATELYFACQKGLKEIAVMLIDSGAKLDILDKDGNTVLLIEIDNVIKRVSSDISIIRALLGKNASISVSNKVGQTPWSLLIQQGDFTNPTTYEIVDLLVQRGIDINTLVNLIDESKTTFLIEVVKAGQIERIKKYIDIGADLYAQTDDGNSAILTMIRRNQLGLLDVIKKLNVDINKIRPDYNGDTPLHLSAKTGNSQITKFFVQKGSSIIEKNIYGETPLEFAVYCYIHGGASSVFFELLEKYMNCCEDILGDALEDINSIVEFESVFLVLIPTIMQMIKVGENELELALALNNINIGRAIVEALGNEKFQGCLEFLSNDDRNYLEEFQKYELDDSHFSHTVAIIPEKPEEEGYQMEALLEIFTELTGFDPQDNEEPSFLERKFKEYLFQNDADRPINELFERISRFIKNCKNRDKLLGIEPGEEEAFWSTVERAVMNTIKALKNSEESEDDLYNRKALLLREYLGIIGYCATRLDLEFEKLYYENCGIVRSFQDEIYFLLSRRRVLVLEGLSPRNSQSVHYIQTMLSELTYYNIPIRSRTDNDSKKLNMINIERSFRNKYLDGLFEEVKAYLQSDNEMQEMFFQWLGENGRLIEKQLPLEETKAFFDHIEQNKELPKDASRLWRDLFGLLPDMLYRPQEKLDEDDRNSILTAYFTPSDWMRGEFEKIKNGETFENLDHELQQVVTQAGMKDNLAIFKTNNVKAVMKEKKKLLDIYIKTYYPKMAKDVKDEDIRFLLQRLGILKLASNAIE